MSLTLGDVLKLSKGITASMRQRDTSVESSRRCARACLARSEPSFDGGGNPDGKSKMAQGELNNYIAEPLPDLFMKSPQYRALYEDNRTLYQVVAEQQLALEMIMEKYRARMAEAVNTRDSLSVTQRCLDKHDGILGEILHEKGVIVQLMGDAIWEDDDGDIALTQHAAQIMKENTYLREIVQASVRMNGRNFLYPNFEDKENQTVLEEAFEETTILPPVEKSENETEKYDLVGEEGNI